MDRIFELVPIVALLVAGVGGGIAAAIRKSPAASASTTGAPTAAPTKTGLVAETVALTILGGLFARILIGVLLDAAGDAKGARLAIGWAFFLVPGIVDAIASIFSDSRPLTDGSVLLWFATVVGAFTGLMAGLHRIYDWSRLGAPQFLGDTTWGLGGSTTAALVAFLNIFIGTCSSDERKGAHRYDKGFRLKEDFAFTQGNVMSSLTDDETQPLYKHERLHVFQNRAFGPGFILSYLGWMALWIIPSLATSLARRDPRFIEGWCYRSNPWEVWAYFIQRRAAEQAEGRDFRSGGEWGPFVLREASAVIYAVPFFLLFVLLFLVAGVTLW
ncbi:MAG: hypothetical protein GEU71_05275 [Actinobacteria bacterium]|nr:hypothetical protein [Actinomycetota bacterium]